MVAAGAGWRHDIVEAFELGDGLSARASANLEMALAALAALLAEAAPARAAV